MSSKYQISASERWRISEPDRPYLTTHAQGRWDERTPPDSVSPEVAWDEGTDVANLDMGYFANHQGDPECVRVFGENDTTRPYCAIMIVMNKTILTVLESRMIESVGVRAYCEAVAGVEL